MVSGTLSGMLIEQWRLLGELCMLSGMLSGMLGEWWRFWWWWLFGDVRHRLRLTLSPSLPAHPTINIHTLARDSGIPAAKFIIGNGGGFRPIPSAQLGERRFWLVVPAVVEGRMQN